MNVIPFPTSYNPVDHRVVEGISLEDFCYADELRQWESRSVVNGMTVLNYPMSVLICTADGSCSQIAYRGDNAEDHFREALAAIA